MWRYCSEYKYIIIIIIVFKNKFRTGIYVVLCVLYMLKNIIRKIFFPA